MTHALKAADAAYRAFKQKNPKPTPNLVTKWAEDAIDPNTGLAFWEKPATKEVLKLVEDHSNIHLF